MWIHGIWKFSGAQEFRRQRRKDDFREYGKCREHIGKKRGECGEHGAQSAER